MPLPDLPSFSRACRRLFAPGLDRHTYVERSYRFLHSLTPGEFIAFGTLRESDRQLTIGFDTSHPDFVPTMTSFGRLMGGYPLYRWDPAINGGRPFCRSQFFSKREFQNLDVYSDVYRPLSIDNHCAVHIPSPTPGYVHFFGIERRGGPDFCDDERVLLEGAQTQLTNALTLAHHLSSSDLEHISPARLYAEGLTPREAETLYWISQGKSNPETALLMGIGVYTVKAHLASIFNKTGAGNRLSAMVWARHVCMQHAAVVTPAQHTLLLPPPK